VLLKNTGVLLKNLDSICRPVEIASGGKERPNAYQPY
jgi:hypothetical protein